MICKRKNKFQLIKTGNIMKKTLLHTASFGLFAAGMAVSSVSQAFTVNDEYIGSDNGAFENTDDYTQLKFDISSMTYSRIGDAVTFTLKASENDDGFGLESYFSAWVNDDTSFFPGDLFLSTDGWSPFTNGNETQPGYGFDAFDEFNQTQNGEDWEYVIQLAGQDDFFNGPQGSGVTQLYNTADGGEIVKGSIRGAQEALYDDESFDGDNTNPLGAGTWNIFDSNGNGVEDSMDITMLLSDGLQGVFDEAALNGESGLGFHWTMSCANDVIEGYVPVPAAVWLFGSGLLGLVGIARRRNKV
jgi:hypothetical protein